MRQKIIWKKLLKMPINIFLTRNMYIYNTPLKFKKIKTIIYLISLSAMWFKFSYIYKFYTIGKIMELTSHILLLTSSHLLSYKTFILSECIYNSFSIYVIITISIKWIQYSTFVCCYCCSCFSVWRYIWFLLLFTKFSNFTRLS